MTLDAQRSQLPAGNNRIAHGPASVESHTPSALKGGPLSRPGFKVLGPVEQEHLGVQFRIQASTDGFWSIVAMPSGLIMVHNPKTKKPWSSYRSCLRWTCKVIAKPARIRDGRGGVTTVRLT